MVKIPKGKWMVPVGERKRRAIRLDVKSMTKKKKVAHKRRINQEAGLRRTARLKSVGKDDPQKRRKALNMRQYRANLAARL
jgi:hypothetical protein